MKEFDRNKAVNLLKVLTTGDEKEFDEIMSKEKEKLMNRKQQNAKVATFVKEGIYPTISDYDFSVTDFSVERIETSDSTEYKIKIRVKENFDFDNYKDEVISKYTYMYNAVQTVRKEFNKFLKNAFITIYDIDLES